MISNLQSAFLKQVMESSVSGLPISSETDEEEGGVHATPGSAPSAPSPPSSHLSFSVENILAPGRFGHHSLHHNHRLAQTFIDDDNEHSEDEDDYGVDVEGDEDIDPGCNDPSRPRKKK